MYSNPDRRLAGGNVVPFARRDAVASPPSLSASSEAFRRAAARRRVDDVDDSAHDRTGSVVTLALFVLFSLFNATLLLAALGARMPW